MDFRPKLPRSHSEAAAELQVKVGDVVEAAVHGDLHDGAGRVLQRLRRLPDADLGGVSPIYTIGTADYADGKLTVGAQSFVVLG